MKNSLTILVTLVCCMAMLTGCLGSDTPTPPQETPPPQQDWPPKTVDVTVEQYKLEFEHEAVSGGYELIWADELRSSYDTEIYEYQYRPYPLENGILRLLAYKYAYIETEEGWSVDVGCEVSDFYDGMLIDTVAIDALPLASYEVAGVTYHDPANSYGWLDQNYIYLGSRSRISIISLLTGEVSVPTIDPELVYMKVSSHTSAYMAVALEPYAMDGKLYYMTYRDPVAVNRYGSIYEADISGERLMVTEATGIVAVADGSVVYTALPEGGYDPAVMMVDRLFCYDTQGGSNRPVFPNTWVELDDEQMIVDGVLLGNEWAGKQEVHDNPPYIISGRQLFFYVSRIAERKVDRYVYDIATGNLLLQEVKNAHDFD